MAYTTGLEIVDMLPEGTAVTPEKAQEYVDAAIERLNDSYGSTPGSPLTAPETARTREMVEDRAYYKSLGYHFLKGEGARSIPAVVEGLKLSDAEYELYDARYQSDAEGSLEAATAYIEEAPW